jgi:hypothetical protein
MNTIDSWKQERRLGGLRRFAVAITVFNILGHSVFGFEQSWVQPFASLATAYTLELLAEWIDAQLTGIRPQFLAGGKDLLNCLLPAHITALAVAMLVYSSDNLLPIMFATAVAIVSKATLRLPEGKRLRHFLNPSNFGITVTLLLFPWVGISPPYHFTENLTPFWSVILPIVIWISGTLLNYRFTGRLPLVLGWVTGFLAQAALRHILFSESMFSALSPMTGVAFVLFTFYMVTDPATTPFATRSQVLFGLMVAAVYGMLMSFHIVFGLFFALTIVTMVRGFVLLVGSQKCLSMKPRATHPEGAETAATLESETL